MSGIRNWFAGLAVVALALPAAAVAQTAPEGWQQVLDKAKTQKLVLINQGSPAFALDQGTELSAAIRDMAHPVLAGGGGELHLPSADQLAIDRKSTRLNSSH